MTPRTVTFAFTTLVLLSSTVAFAQEVAPDDVAPDAPTVDAPAEGADPAAEPPLAPAEGSDPASSASPSETDTPPPANDDAKPNAGAPSDEKAPPPPAEAEEPMGGFAAFAIAYGMGAASMGIMHGLVTASAALSVASSILGVLISPIVPPIASALQVLSFLACCFLPAGQGALINLVGDGVTGSEPSLAYLWTILASYVSCYAFSCAGALVIFGVLLGIVGTQIIGLFTGQPTAGQVDYTYVTAGTMVGVFGVVALVQPLVPAGVYAATRDTGASDEDINEYVDTDDEYVRAPSVPGARPEVALGTTRAAAMAF